jgi:hypothetical protein
VTRTIAIAIACAALAVAAASGCGGGGSAPPGSAQGAAQQLLGQKDVARYPTGSPARTLFEWWRSAQFADPSGYRDSFVPAVRTELVADKHALDALGYFSGAIRDARPRVLGVVARNDRATIYAMVEYHQPVGTKRYITSTVPRAFTLRRMSGRWLLDNDAFVQSTLPGSLRRGAAS